MDEHPYSFTSTANETLPEAAHHAVWYGEITGWQCPACYEKRGACGFPWAPAHFIFHPRDGIFMWIQTGDGGGEWRRFRETKRKLIGGYAVQ